MHRQTVAAAHGDRRPTYNYQQVMDALGCSKRHVYNLFDRGDLAGYRVGSQRGLRIFVESVNLFLMRQQENA